MMPRKAVAHRDQSPPALCRAWVYRDDGPTSYVRCDTPLHCELSSKSVTVVCPWHPDKVYGVLPDEQDVRNVW